MMAFKNISTSLRQNHQRAVVASGRRDLHEVGFLEVSQIARAGVERTFLTVSHVASRHDAEGANNGERARFGAAQRDVATAGAHALAFGTARQVEILHEHVAGIECGTIASVRQTAAAALAQVATVIVIAWIVRPTRIENSRSRFVL